MKRIFPLNTKTNVYSYFGIAQSSNADATKIELRYFEVTENFNIIEIDICCAETIKIEKMCRKWCIENDLILWSC